MIEIAPNRLKNESHVAKFIEGAPRAMYDIGVGPKSEWLVLQSLYPTMKLYGCEPDATQYAELREQFSGQLAQVAIAEQPGTATLYCRRDSPMNNSLIPIPKCSHSYDVPAWTLDQFDQWAGKPNRILLWMDIEGSELAALKGGHELLSSRRVRWINLEERREGRQPGGGWAEPSELRTLLKDYGYRVVSEYNRHPTHQDVIYMHRLQRRP